MKRTFLFVFVVILMLVLMTPLLAAVKIEQMKYGIYGQCYSMNNGTVEIIVTADLGPRIISYRLLDGKNILGELDKKTVTKTDYGEWHPWGGHRLWHAPEAMPRSYVPDDTPVTIKQEGNNALRITEQPEKQTGILKEMLVKMDESGPGVEIIHYLTNKGTWNVELAPWALTIVRTGGEAIIPNEPFRSHDDYLLSARRTVLWYFTDLSDPRWIFGSKYLRLKCDAARSAPQKIGVENERGWAGFLQDGTLFIKRFPYDGTKTYTDRGCNNEIYTAGTFMEVESLGYMHNLEPGQVAKHIERWYLFGNVKPGTTEESLDSAIQPLVKKTKAIEND